MTISIANVAVATDSFDQWIVKTNLILDALSNKAVTTNSNTAVGNAAVSNAFSANTLYANTISGGNTTSAADVSFSTNTTFASNATFTGTRTNLGLAANVAIQGGNSTFRVVTVNSAGGNTLSVTKINTSDLSDLNISAPADGDVLVYNSGSTKWVNSGVISSSNATFSNLTVTNVANVNILRAVSSANLASTTLANSSGLFVSTGAFPVSNSSGTALGNNTNRWIITANTGSFSGAVTVGDTLSVTNNLTLNSTLIANGSTGTGGQFLTSNGASGSPYWSTISSIVSSITGTANQVIASASTGPVTLSLPQSIATTSSVQFGSFGVGTAASGTSGEIRATNNITAYYSDDRLKTRLGNIESSLAKVKSLTGFYYEANETAQALGYKPIREVGISAQDVQAVLPEVVAPAPIDEQYLTVRYEKLVPLLIEAIKELSAEVEKLKNGTKA